MLKNIKKISELGTANFTGVPSWKGLGFCQSSKDKVHLQFHPGIQQGRAGVRWGLGVATASDRKQWKCFTE